jgi:hypothetical protein
MTRERSRSPSCLAANRCGKAFLGAYQFAPGLASRDPIRGISLYLWRPVNVGSRGSKPDGLLLRGQQATFSSQTPRILRKFVRKGWANVGTGGEGLAESVPDSFVP